MNCEICKNVYPKYASIITKTEDKHNICKYCYDKVFDELFKGQFTLQEAKETMTFLNEYEEALKSYLLIYRKYGALNLEKIHITLSNVIKLEEEISNTKFCKPRQVQRFHCKGHLDLIIAIIPLIGTMYPKIDNNALNQFVLKSEESGSVRNTILDVYLSM